MNQLCPHGHWSAYKLRRFPWVPPAYIPIASTQQGHPPDKVLSAQDPCEWYQFFEYRNWRNPPILAVDCFHLNGRTSWKSQARYCWCSTWQDLSLWNLCTELPLSDQGNYICPSSSQDLWSSDMYRCLQGSAKLPFWHGLTPTFESQNYFSWWKHQHTTWGENHHLPW